MKRPDIAHDSAVVLERVDSAASSPCGAAFVRKDSLTDGISTGDAERGEATAAPVALDLSVRFGRIGVVTVAAVAVLVGLTVQFNRGVIIGHFDPTAMDEDAQKKLLDDYNSYTGNVASAFTGPVGLVVGLAVQLTLLRALAASLLRAEVSWKMHALTLALTTGVGYLIGNGLNALNVQPQPPRIEAMISATDLAYVSEASTSDASARSSNLTRTFSERSPRNPITNTVLRNLVLPREFVKKQSCSRATNSDFSLPTVVAEYGFSQRDWQSHLLQEAPEPKQLRVLVNPLNKTAAPPVNVKDLPMNASLAADLFIYSMFASQGVLQSGSADVFGEVDARDRYRIPRPNAAARDFHFLPPASPVVDEMAQREYFLSKSAEVLKNGSAYTARSGVVMEFSHVEISPSMRVDAITIELEADPALMADVTTKDNSTWFSGLVPTTQCGPWPLRCFLTNPGHPVLKSGSEYDPPAQVQVFGSCKVNSTEQLHLIAVPGNSQRPTLICDSISNTSLIVVSVGKRFVAASVEQNKTANASGVFDSVGDGVVTNLRRIYTYTIAKLSWDILDLTTEFNAKCAGDAASCKGLRFPLLPTKNNQSTQQELIVGVDALPLNLIGAPDFGTSARFLSLVKLHESAPIVRGVRNDTKPLTLDPLLPHNFGKLTWDMSRDPNDSRFGCDVLIGESLQLVHNNHWYIEDGLQTAYTAATFFLLQNAVVKDVITLNASQKSLNFARNQQKIDLLASIPDQNAWLTFAGCAVLVVGLGAVLVWAWATSKTIGGGRFGALGRVTTPHVIARVMLDSAQFPPMFLHRHVVGVSDPDGLGAKNSGDSNPIPPTVEGFVIDGLTLQAPPSEKNVKETL